MEKIESTPLEVIANVSRVVTRVIDRITGDRVEVPLMVAAACSEALKKFDIQSQIMYGSAAWVEILEDNSVVWAGCWGDHYNFWVATQFGEVVDLNASIAYRKQAHQVPSQVPVLSPPMLWSLEVPAFYRFIPTGIAELELTSESDQRQYEIVLKEIHQKCGPSQILGLEPEFPNEPILCPGRRVLDDSQESFKKFDRVIGVRGIPKAPF